MDAPTTHHPAGRTNKSSDVVIKRVLIILLIVATVLAIVLMVTKFFLVRPTGRNINKKEYQALFLTNGQVYFGKLSHTDDNYVRLTDIYYLQTQPAQPSSGSSAASASSQSLSLAKLGNELHGPEDSMFVAKDQVLFWENLKDSGKVVTAIKSYQSTQK